MSTTPFQSVPVVTGACTELVTRSADKKRDSREAELHALPAPILTGQGA